MSQLKLPKSGPCFIELLEHKTSFNKFLRIKSEHNNSHKWYLIHGIFAGDLNLLSITVLCLATFSCLSYSMKLDPGSSLMLQNLKKDWNICSFICWYERKSKCVVLYASDLVFELAWWLQTGLAWKNVYEIGRVWFLLNWKVIRQVVTYVFLIKCLLNLNFVNYNYSKEEDMN